MNPENLTATVNTIKTTDDKLTIRSDLNVEGNVTANGFIGKQNLYPDITSPDISQIINQAVNQAVSQGVTLGVISKLLESITTVKEDKNRLSEFEIPLKIENKNFYSLRAYKGFECYLWCDILISEDKVKVLNKYSEGFKEIKLNYSPSRKTLIFDYKLKCDHIDKNELKITLI